MGLTLLPLALNSRAESTFRSYKVQPGDTIARLSWIYNVSGDRIRAMNSLGSGELQPGSTIRIPVLDAHSIPSASANVQPAVPVAKPAIVEERRAVSASTTVVAPKAQAAPTSPREVLKQEEEEQQPRSSHLDAGRLVSLARSMQSKRLAYGQAWVPPGESTAWVMDCSNTARYTYRALIGMEIGRTASEQYVNLTEQRRIYKVGGNPSKILNRLRPGDLLFWENTYKPVRKPPITHVMVYLGKDRQGRSMMFGSQSRRSGGPGIYPFDPAKHSGGFSSWLGIVSHKGKFVAYGRPAG